MNFTSTNGSPSVTAFDEGGRCMVIKRSDTGQGLHIVRESTPNDNADDASTSHRSPRSTGQGPPEFSIEPSNNPISRQPTLLNLDAQTDSEDSSESSGTLRTLSQRTFRTGGSALGTPQRKPQRLLPGGNTELARELEKRAAELDRMIKRSAMEGITIQVKVNHSDDNASGEQLTPVGGGPNRRRLRRQSTELNI